ncbi:MAG TPA: DUF1573 domain-containing protein [Clostridia bacterium]|jgi:hypothetical protein|nr:DUF1573 domain-containing protein [Clostridia bacterium]
MHESTDFQQFQNTVNKYLIRHRSIIDITSKLQETNAKVNRALAKAITQCGCTSIKASKQRYCEVKSLDSAHTCLKTHLEGELCPDCKEILASEIGHNLFYLAALCQVTGLSLEQIINEENNRLQTLGYFSMT